MFDNFNVAEKNFFTCALMMAIVGTSLIFMGSKIYGIVCIVFAVVFIIAPLIMHAKDAAAGKSEVEKKPSIRLEVKDDNDK